MLVQARRKSDPLDIEAVATWTPHPQAAQGKKITRGARKGSVTLSPSAKYNLNTEFNDGDDDEDFAV